MRSGETAELFFGEHPHSRQDNNTYARFKDGSIQEFSGHRRLFKIEIEEYNYLKESHLSGDEIRKGGNVKVFIDDIQIMDEFCRSYEMGYKLATKFIDDIKNHHQWFPHELNQWEEKTIGYREQLCKIKRFIVDQGCMMLETLDGKPFQKFLWEDKDEYDKESSVKVEINSPQITWYIGK